MHHGVWKISLKCGWHWTIFKGLERKKRLYCSSFGLSYFEIIEAHSKAEFYTCFSFNHLFLNHPKIFGWNSLIFKQRCEEHHNMISYSSFLPAEKLHIGKQACQLKWCAGYAIFVFTEPSSLNGQFNHFRSVIPLPFFSLWVCLFFSLPFQRHFKVGRFCFPSVLQRENRFHIYFYTYLNKRKNVIP